MWGPVCRSIAQNAIEVAEQREGMPKNAATCHMPASRPHGGIDVCHSQEYKWVVHVVSSNDVVDA